MQKVTRIMSATLLALITIFSFAVQAAPAQPVHFDAKQNELCWRMIEQKATGHCKLHFSFGTLKPVTDFPKRDIIGYGIRKKENILRHKSDKRAHPSHIPILHGDTIQ